MAIGNLDGLLAAHFTVPGVRVVSVMNLLGKKRINRSVQKDALAKARSAVNRLKSYAERESHGSPDWLAGLLRDYDVESPVTPKPVAAGTGDLAVSMAIDPAFSYSTRRPSSDGLITDKTNVAMDGTRYAALLTHIGAARFLRAQRVANNLVNFYVPIPDSIVLHADTGLPLLYSFQQAPNHALAKTWLTYSHVARRTFAVDWTRLSNNADTGSEAIDLT